MEGHFVQDQDANLLPRTTKTASLMPMSLLKTAARIGNLFRYDEPLQVNEIQICSGQNCDSSMYFFIFAASLARISAGSDVSSSVLEPYDLLPGCLCVWNHDESTNDTVIYNSMLTAATLELQHATLNVLSSAQHASHST